MSALACGTALLFLLDASPSIERDQWALMVEGHARAVTSERVLDAVERDGLAVAVGAFAGTQEMLLEWRVLRTRIEAAEWAADLLQTHRTEDYGTRIGAALRWAGARLQQAPCGEWRVIDLVTDGEANSEPLDATAKARDALDEEGVRVNALAVGDDGSLGQFLVDNAVTPGGFVLQVATFQQVGRALVRKVSMEVGALVGHAERD